MSTAAETALLPAEDGFARYYAEKLWSWIPEYYRELDGEPPTPGALRAVVEIVAEQAATIRRDIDRLWDDQSVELCDDWAVAYLGELVGATPLSQFNLRGSRVAVANAVAYQRRKGTPALMQALIRDTAALEGVVVEAFRRLARFAHRLDVDTLARPSPRAFRDAPVTDSPSGGFVDMRSPRLAGLTGGPFDEAAHFPDVRRLRGPLGRWGIRKLNFHLFPLRSLELTLPTPQEIAPGRSTLDPSGRERPQLQRGQTSDRPPDAIRETDLPDIILCRRFNATRHLLSASALAEIDDPTLDAALAPLLGLAFRDGASFRRVAGARLTTPALQALLPALLDSTLTAEAPKAVLWPDSLALAISDESGGDPLPPSGVIAADLSAWGAAIAFEDFVALVVDPATGRLLDGPDRGSRPLFVERLHYGEFQPVGAGTYPRGAFLSREVTSEIDAGPTGADDGFTDAGPATASLPSPLDGVHRFTTSRTYEPPLPPGRVFDAITTARLEAADGARPYLRVRPDAATLDVTFRAAAGDGTPRELTLDGLWLGLVAATVAPEIVGAEIPATPVAARLVLDGDFDRVTLRHVTLDPGGERARNDPTEAVAIPYVRLEIEGQVGLLRILRSVTGPIHETMADPDLCNAGEIEICDSVVQALDPAQPAILTRLGHVRLLRSTVIGRVEVARLFATDSLIDGRVRVTDPQHGCFRYSATGDFAGEPEGPAELPPRFEALVAPGRPPARWLVSRRWSDPWFAAISELAPEALRSGASTGSEMGAFSGRGLPVLLQDLAAQVRAHAPVGQTPQNIIERGRGAPS